MLPSSRTTRLCTNCRYDLLTIFERGFCTSNLPRPFLRQSRLQKFRSQPPRRAISYTSRLLQARHEEADSKEPGSQRSSPVDDSPDQLAAIQALEDQLGKPIEEAIEDDQLAALLEEDVPKDDEHASEETVEAAQANNPIATLRDAGVEPEEVAREARQLFGESLPEGVLDEHETKLYTRLYGEPEPEMEEELDEDEDLIETENELLDQDGDPVDYDIVKTEPSTNGIDQEVEATPEEDEDVFDNAAAGRLDLSDTLQSRIASIAKSLDGEVLENSDENSDVEEDESYQREHPLTRLGKFATKPETVNLPREEYMQPLQDVMSGYSNKHLKDVCERTFGGPGLPDSPLTPRTGKLRPQVAVSLEASQFAMSEMEANAFLTAVMPPAYAAVTSVLVETRKRLGPTWLTELLAKDGGPRVLDAGAGGAGILAWNEVVKAHWNALHTDDKDTPPPPPTKAVVLTHSDALRHRSSRLLANTTFVPRLPDYKRTRDSPTLDDDRPAQQRKQFDFIIAPYTLLPQKEDWEKKLYVQNLWSLLSSSGGVLILIEKGIPRGFEAVAGARELLLERYISSPVSHSTDYNTVPEAQTEADAVSEKAAGMIVAPCTNHNKCPLYKVPGKSQGRKDYCAFQQRYTRPLHLQRVLGASDRNYDDVDFSYVSVMKGRDLRQHGSSTFDHIVDPLTAPLATDISTISIPPTTASWIEQCQDGFSTATPTPDTSDPSTTAIPTYPPLHLLPRLIFPPMKRRGHILLDMCTPLGTIERWTVPRSFSKQAYRDARKSQWGDLWALGAKTRINRNIKVGVGSKEVREMMKQLPGGGGGRGIGTGTGKGNEKEVWVGKGRNREERLKNQAVKLVQQMEEEKQEEKDDLKAFERDLAEEMEPDVDTEASARRTRPKRNSREKTSWSPTAPKTPATEIENDPALSQSWKDWNAEYAADADSGLARKRGGSFRTAGVGKSSKAAKRFQKELKWRATKEGSGGGGDSAGR